MIKRLRHLNIYQAIFLLSIMIAAAKSGRAQQDTIFWFAAPDVSAGEGDSPIALKLLSYNEASTVTISQPANPGFTPIVEVLAANSEALVDLTPFKTLIESPAANSVSNTGLKIVATKNITAYYDLTAPNNKEIFSLKGNKSIGTNFYTPFQKFWNNATTTPGTFSSIEIVATEDNTTVLITPRANITGHLKDMSFVVMLNDGQTYSARDTDLASTTSLSGSIVSSNKPIAVTLFSGALSSGGCKSTMGDQIVPTDYLGKNHIISKGTALNERVYVLATENATSITLNDALSSTVLSVSEVMEINIDQSVNYIKSNKPIYVWHASGNGCNLAGAQVPGVFCSGKYEQAFSRSSSDSLGLIVYTRSGFENQFEINGNTSLLTAADFSPVLGSGGEFVVAKKYFTTAQIPLNIHQLITNEGDIFGFGVLQGQSGNGSSLAYLNEYVSYPFVEAGPMNDVVCAGVAYPITGVVGGGSITGQWSSNGFGSFALAATNLSNSYIPSDLDTILSKTNSINLILTSTGSCALRRDTIKLNITPAPFVNAGADRSVCANNPDFILNGALLGSAESAEWSTSGTGTFAPDRITLNATYTPSLADAAAGAVTLTLSSTNTPSCTESSDEMILTITPEPTVNPGPENLIVCANNPAFALNGTVSGGATSGKWTTSGNGSFNPDNLSLTTDYVPSAQDIAQGTIKIYLTSTGNGKCSSSADSIIVTFSDGPVVNAGADILACKNESTVQLTGSVSGTTSSGEWIGGNGTFTPDRNSLNATYTPTPAEVTTGVLTLRLRSTINGFCNPVSDQVRLTFTKPPTANFNFNEVCLGKETVFSDFSNNGFGSINSWKWSFGDGSSSSTTKNTTHLFTNFGTYNIELIVGSDAGCFDTLVKPVVIHEIPTAMFDHTSSCTNNIVRLNFENKATAPNETIDYWFYDFGGQGKKVEQNPSQEFVGSGDFVITQIVRTEFGCTDTVINIINIPSKPIAGFFFNTSGGLNVDVEYAFIDTSKNASSWNWMLGNGENSILQNPSTIYTENKTYTVTQFAVGALGCVDSLSKQITINTLTDDINGLIPNAISPNGDGKNDIWKLKFLESQFPAVEVLVMNRWGQTLFESVGYSEPWDGTFNGELVPEGTYYYIINLSEEEVYKGTILVLTSNDN